MKSKQLANVLIKILGLFVLINAIPTILGALMFVQQLHSIHIVPTLVIIGIGIYLIVRSRDVAALLFKTDDE
jgi:hypothetical protein